MLARMATEEIPRSDPRHSAPHCERCNGGAMELVRSNPGIGSLRELRTYRCAHCGHVETIEVR